MAPPMKMMRLTESPNRTNCDGEALLRAKNKSIWWNHQVVGIFICRSKAFRISVFGYRGQTSSEDVGNSVTAKASVSTAFNTRSLSSGCYQTGSASFFCVFSANGVSVLARAQIAVRG